ncbi:putative EamA domain-containing protein [Seiridium cardinale]|uniref:EamA domain-containing protein n=1 Tax=Seiridium cardinale TaxID=138064 RepID=A0ABR2XQ19_9PEZI
MPSLAAISIYVFGLTAFGAGVFTLLDPASAAAAHGFPSVCMPVARGNSLAAIAMGIYYTLAGYQENTTFFMLTVPMRLLTTAVFWNQGWTAPAVWEGSGALLTLGALMLRSRTADGRIKAP